MEEIMKDTTMTRHEQFLNYIAHPNDVCPDPMTREEYLLKEIAEHKDEPSGAQLPNPTESDKGKFAHVNEDTGSLEYAEASSGGEGFVVTITVEGYDTTISKTYAEILAAHQAGSTIVFEYYKTEDEVTSLFCKGIAHPSKHDGYTVYDAFEADAYDDEGNRYALYVYDGYNHNTDFGIYRNESLIILTEVTNEYGNFLQNDSITNNDIMNGCKTNCRFYTMAQNGTKTYLDLMSFQYNRSSIGIYIRARNPVTEKTYTTDNPIENATLSLKEDT